MRKTTSSNPSKIASLNKAYEQGLLTKEELIRLKKEALKINVYKQKVKIKKGGVYREENN